ncbi:MAG: sialate O-acetylesterase [Planctomycetaceae bacterium]|nr:sialate O-acetylesterase [Planctomycetaceae bacterium]
MIHRNIKTTHYVSLPFLLSVLICGTLCADELQISGIFTDRAVIQRDRPIPVWGTTKADAKVTVEFAGQSKSATAAANGSWQVLLEPLPANASGSSMFIESEQQRIELHDLLVGEVWYASGQSNMQMKLAACAKKIESISKIANSPETANIRMIRIDDHDSPKPLRHRKKQSTWQRDTPNNRAQQSAVAYFFARHLHAELKVPIGIIEGSWGGKPVEGFIPRDQFQRHASLQPILSLAEQNKLEQLSRLEGGVIVRNTAGMPARIFNARVAPIAPFAVRGFIWYQGESNAGRGEDPRNYRIKMQALIEGWRAAWNQSDLPFYFVQLPAFNNSATGWIRLREEQRRSLEIPQTGMAVTIDLRDSDIHPSNKLDVGNRLARWALAKTYDQDIEFSGPLFQAAIIEKDSIRVEFDNAMNGLMIARKEGISSPVPTPNAELAHFELADETGEWQPAQATIEGSIVRVSSPRIKNPKAVRYACSGDPENANLYNQTGLPASPFCSDLQLLPWASASPN